MQIDRSTVVGGVAGVASGVPLAFPLQWIVKVKYGIEMPLEAALPIAMFLTGLVGTVQGVITHWVPSSPRTAKTNTERRAAGLLPDLNQPLSPADIADIQSLIDKEKAR